MFKTIWKYYKSKRILVFLIVASALMCNCTKQINKSIDDAMLRITKNTPALVDSLVLSAEKQLLAAKFQSDLRLALDSIVGSAGNTLRDSLLSKKTDSLVAALVRTAINEGLGSNTQSKLEKIKYQLLGVTTERLLNKMAISVKDSLLSQRTENRLLSIRDSLLGPKTDTLISHLITSAIDRAAQRYKAVLSPEIHAELTWIQKNVEWLIALIALIAIGIIGYVWYQKRKYLQITQLLTLEIQRTNNQDHYDELTHRIREKAQDRGLEGSLREILSQQDILGEEAWKKDLSKLKKLNG